MENPKFCVTLSSLVYILKYKMYFGLYPFEIN